MADEMSRALTAEMKRRGAGAQKVVAGMSAELARLRSELERVKGESASNADHARIANANFRAMDKARAINLAHAEAAEARIAGLEAAGTALADQAEHCIVGHALEHYDIGAAVQRLAEAVVTFRAALQPISPEGR